MFKPKISDKKLKELAAAEGDAEFEVKPPEPRILPPRTRIVLQRNEEPPRLTVYSVDFLDELPLGLHGWLTTAEHEALLSAARAEARAEAFEEAAKECESWWDLFDFDSFDPSDGRRCANPNHIAARIRGIGRKLQL